MLQPVTSQASFSAEEPEATESSLLLELQVPFRRIGGVLHVESQALNGLHCWSDHFNVLTVCAPLVPDDLADDNTITWEDPKGLLASRNVRLVPLPWGYHPREHLRHMASVRAKLHALIETHRYLCFSNVGGFGAWGSVGASEARRMQRRYSLWFDWVVHEMIGAGGPAGSDRVQAHVPLKRRVKQGLDRVLSFYETHRAILGCDLGLFHGRTVYEAYAPFCRTPALVHDVHVKPHDAISDVDLAHKRRSIAVRDTLNIGYAGRVHPMKAPLAWVESVIRVVRRLGSDRVQATWVGDGPLLEQMRQRVRDEGLEGSVSFPGFLEDRAALLAFLRGLDVFLFCHVTSESPRCLLESVISGTPLVGFESAFARDVVGERGGGLFVPVHDVAGLAEQLCRLAEDRRALEQLTIRAAANRALYNDAAVFAHRSQLIKAHLP